MRMWVFLYSSILKKKHFSFSEIRMNFGRGNGAAWGRFGLMRDIQWSWRATLPRIFFSPRIYLHPDIPRPWCLFILKITLPGRLNCKRPGFWHTFRNPVVCMAGPGRYSVAAAHSSPAHAPSLNSPWAAKCTNSTLSLHTTLLLLKTGPQQVWNWGWYFLKSADMSSQFVADVIFAAILATFSSVLRVQYIFQLCSGCVACTRPCCLIWDKDTEPVGKYHRLN